MAIIYSYPQGSSALQNDRLIITRIDEEENEITTKQLTLGQIADYIIETSPVVSGTGTPNYLPIWGAGGGSLVDSQLRQVGNNLTVGANATITGTLNTRILEVSNGVNANQIRVQTNIPDYRPGLIIGSNTNVGARIKLEHTDDNISEWDAFILSRDGAVSIGRVDGVSTNNLNIKKDNGYVGIKQTAPLAPLHIKKGGEAIRLETTENGICSIDFRQGTNKRGHIQFENENDTLAIQTENPSGDTSKIKFSIAANGQDAEEVMRIQSTVYGKKQVVIGNIPVVYSQRELHIIGDAEVTRDLWVGRNAEIDGRCHADSFKVEDLNAAPGSATASGKQGEIRFTRDYIYVCITENNWKRTALTSW